MDEMIQKISVYPNGTFLKIIWSCGKIVVEGVIDTVYETDNGLDGEEDNYQEFYACAFMVKKVLKNLSKKSLSENQLIEISQEEPPTSIELENGTVIWEKQL